MSEAPTHPDHGELLILGLGNLLCADDGLGVEVVTRLLREWRAPKEVRILDGGTLGMSLLHWIAETPKVILADAIADDAPPGSFVRLEADEVAPAVRERLSVHQVGVTDLLDALRLIDAYPRQLVLLGLVPESTELRVGLSPSVAAHVDELVAAVVAEAERLGYTLERRDEPRHAISSLPSAARRTGATAGDSRADPASPLPPADLSASHV